MGKKVGDMTNCVWSPRLSANIGYGLLSVNINPGDLVEIERDGTIVKARVVDLPFI